MEPANLNLPPDDDAQLAAWLRADSPHLPDHGFSVQVLAALPRRRTARSLLPPLGACVAGALGGLGFALRNGASWSGVASVLHEEAATCSLFFSDPWFALALALTGLCLLVTFVLIRRSAPFSWFR